MSGKRSRSGAGSSSNAQAASPPKKSKITRSTSKAAGTQLPQSVASQDVLEVATTDDDEDPVPAPRSVRIKVEPGYMEQSPEPEELASAIELANEAPESPFARDLRKLLAAHNVSSPSSSPAKRRTEPIYLKSPSGGRGVAIPDPSLETPTRRKDHKGKGPQEEEDDSFELVASSSRIPDDTAAAEVIDDDKDNNIDANSDDSEAVLDLSAQAPCLKDQYNALKNVPPFVAAEIVARTKGRQPDPPQFPSFTRWAENDPKRLDEFRGYFAFVSSSEYVNPARAFPCPFIALPVHARNSTGRTAHHNLIEAEVTASGWKRKSLLAVPFLQEESLIIANLGKAFGAKSLFFTIWNAGFQYGTTLEQADARHTVHGRKSRSFKSAAATHDSQITLRLTPDTKFPVMGENPAPGSLGNVIYTVTADKNESGNVVINLNIQAYIHLSDPIAGNVDADLEDELIPGSK
ncbi:hypothetical protein EXIGLDRAFT_763472 [Exidia glandulosa HHB12029]|uniref:Uncharacterized protein n=1 Tax=Exidia glandulosa HHB12029 TaxID=1314781 RepID=A0A165LXL4_EXIGL|nr:hypothetical protein EXIGLDRAFT_763472 [Exidia glandulosa HHB12029]